MKEEKTCFVCGELIIDSHHEEDGKLFCDINCYLEHFEGSEDTSFDNIGGEDDNK